MILRQVMQHGSSLVVVFPPVIRDVLRVKLGHPVGFELDQEGRVCVVNPKSPKLGKGVVKGLLQELEDARRDLRHYKARAEARPQRVYHMGFSAGFNKAWGAEILELQGRASKAQAVLEQLQTQLNAVAGSDLPELADGVQAIRTALEKLTAPVTPSQ